MENTEEKIIKEKVFWSGEEISDKFLAQYYSNMLDDIRIDNQLLGQFEGEKYFFTEDIKKALIAIRKRVDDKNGDSYFVVSKTLKKVLSFKMRVFKVSDGTLLAANLYLIEIVDDPRFQKPLKTFIAQYVDKNNDEFVNKAKYIFNINVEDEFLEAERQENESQIGNKFPKILSEREDVIEDLNKKFLEELIPELEKCGEEGKKIVEDYKKELEATSSDKKISYTVLKKKIDILIEKNGGLKFFTEKNPKIKEVISSYSEKVFATKKEAKKEEISIEQPKKQEEKKQEEKSVNVPKAVKPTASSSASSKDKSGGGAKSGGGKSKPGGGKAGANKKKEEKKDKTFTAEKIEEKKKEEQPNHKNKENTVEKPKEKQDLSVFDNFDYVCGNLESFAVSEEKKSKNSVYEGLDIGIGEKRVVVKKQIKIDEFVK